MLFTTLVFKSVAVIVESNRYVQKSIVSQKCLKNIKFSKKFGNRFTCVEYNTKIACILSSVR